MSNRSTPCLLLLLSLSACQSFPGSTATASKPHRAAAQTASAATRLLQAPVDAMKLEGTVQLDASYLVTKAGGQLIAGPDGNVATPEGGKLVGAAVVSNDGSSLIAPKAGNVIAEDGAGVISNDGSSVVSNDGSSVVSNDGSSVVSNDGSSIIAQGGGNAVGTHTASYQLTAADVPAFGEQLPAVGMVVQVRTLRDGKPVPVGIDTHGKPAYAIYTNLDGKFTLYLPRSVAANVRIYATPKAKTDRKLQYAVVGMGNAAARIDEDTSLCSGYILSSLTGRTKAILTGTDEQFAGASRVYGDFDLQLRTAAKSANVAAMSAANQDKLARQLTNLLLSPVDFSRASFEDENGNQVNSLDAMTEIMSVTRDNMAKRMTALQAGGTDPTTYFAGLPFMQPANALGLKIERPSDFLNVLVAIELNKLETNELVRFQHVHDDVIAAGLQTDDARMLKLAAASNGLLTYIATTLKGATVAQQEALALVRGAKN